jgi:hypothetical protein
MAHTLEQNQAQEKMSDFSRLFSEIKSQQITCLICLNSISEETVSRIKECKHLFCYECISKWAKTKLTCPLCTKKFEVIEFHFASDGTCEEKKFEEPTKRPDDVDVDLSCLDFNYFLDEVNRLLENGERLFAMTKALARQNGKVHLHFSNDSKLTPTLHTVLCTLRNIQTDLLNEVRFDPLVLIQQLYDIENTLKELWNGRTPTSMPQHSQRTENDRLGRFDADEFGEDDEDEDEECEERDEEELFMYPSNTNTPKKAQHPSFRKSGERHKHFDHKRWK